MSKKNKYPRRGVDCDGVETFKQMFLLDRTKKIPVARSTTELNKIEFGEYFDKIKYKVAEIGIILPEPDDCI